MAVVPLRADPVPSLDQLTVIDQGRQITILWHFFYKLLPAKFSVPENNLQIALDDPATLKPSLARLASSAFVLTLDGQPAPLTKLAELTVAPDGGCFATLLYPGRQNAHLQLRETLLPLYPASYVINYQIYSPLAPARGVSGYFTGGGPAPAIDYTQISGNLQPSLFDSLRATPVRLLEAEVRTAWINPNWLLLAILLVLMRPATDLYPLALLMAAAWIVPCFFWIMDALQVPWGIHPFVPGLITAILCFVGLTRAMNFPTLGAMVVLDGLLNSCFDIQQTSLERPAADVVNLIGAGVGFVVGLALIFIISYLLIAECRKFPGFDRDWKPKIVWSLAALALILSFVP